MATSLKSLTGVGADARKLAKLLQAKAPEGHMLAYINPREAALLKAYGGSGKPEPETGIPSFQDEGAPDFGAEGTFEAADATPVESTFTTYDPAGYSYAGQPVTSGAAGTDLQLSSFPPARETPAFDTTRPATADAETARLLGGGGEQKEGIAQQLAKATGMKEETLGRLGIAGIQGLLGARQASRAAKAGQAGRQEIQALATPYQQKGQELQAQAQRGELTPQAMQSLQAAQAQVAQGVQNRGGVGAAQAQMQIEQLRQQLLQGQYDYGLKLSGIGDNIALGAIKTGMQADQYANQLTNSYFNNIARTIFSQGGQTPTPPTQE
jgi:hypothetical protein